MRFFNHLGRGLLAASTLAALQVASPICAQYTPYPQAAAPAFAPPVQQQVRPQQQAPVQQQAAVQPSVPQQQSYAPPQTYASSQPYAQPAPAQQAQAQSSYTQVAQRPVAQPAVSQQPQQAFSAPATQGYNPQQPPQAYAPPTVYSQYAPAQGSAPARPGVATPTYMAAAQNAAPAQSYSQQQQPQYSAPYSPPRMAMAYQTPAPASPSLELTTPTENIGTGQVHAGNGPNMPQPVPGADYAPAQGYAAQGYAAQNGTAATGADCNCQTNGYESYPGHGYGNATAYGANNYSTYGCEQPGMMARVLGKHGGGYWFGGVYGLLMERDSTNEYALSSANGSLAPGDYPMPPDYVLSTSDAETGFQGGIEFRLGRTFGGGSSDPCGGCACGPTWGLETVYWTLFEDDGYAQYSDTASLRTYTMMPMGGLMYNGRPVNHYTDYGAPVSDYTAGGFDEIQVRLVRTRSSFEMQNFELNLLRLSLCGNACATPAMCNVDGCDTGTCATGDCATGGCDASGYGYGVRSGFGSRFSCTGVCGFRYLEFDESFMYGVDFENMDTPGFGYLDYFSETENKLAGFQLGCNGMYRIGCKWGVHMNSLVGVYGNDIDVRQYFNAPTGGGAVTYTGGENFDVMASKTDVAMLGELRVGASYQATCRMRLYGGWRAMGVSGLALAGDQAPNAFLNASQMSNYVNSNGSMILHGLQTGVEWNY